MSSPFLDERSWKNQSYIRATVTAEMALLVPPSLRVIEMPPVQGTSPPTVAEVILPLASRLIVRMVGDEEVDLARHVTPKVGSLKTNE